LEESNHGQTCPYEEITEESPFFNLYDHTLVYSVKEKTSIKFICKNLSRPVGHEHETRYIQGIGAATIAPDCQILFPNGMRAFSNPEPKIENMGSLKFMDNFNFLPSIDNYTNIIPLPVNITPFKELKLTQVDTTAYKSLLEEIINPQSALPEIIRVTMGILIFIASFIVTCFIFPKVGVWFKTITLWKNPKTWWTDFKHYDLPSFNKNKPNSNGDIPIEEIERSPIRPILKNKFRKQKKQVNRPITNAITQSLIENLLSQHRNHDSRLTYNPEQQTEIEINNTNNVNIDSDKKQNSSPTAPDNNYTSYKHPDLYPTIHLRPAPVHQPQPEAIQHIPNNQIQHVQPRDDLDRIDTVVIDQPIAQHEYLRTHFSTHNVTF